MSTTATPEPSSRIPHAEARNSLRDHGKSFYFAGKVLGEERLSACARLYRFCRYVDDLADDATDVGTARRKLNDVLHSLSIRGSDEPIVSDFLSLADDCAFDLRVTAELIKGVRGDLEEVEINSSAALYRYCYRVAGTVGLMMCNVLGVRDTRAMPFAIDLGIAMQLTNIARDVSEDAGNGRRYLPQIFLHGARLRDLEQGAPRLQGRLRSAVRELLSDADRFYRSGEAGLVYLPLRARFSILIASRTYQAIGGELAKRGYRTWNGRVFVSQRQKWGIAAKAAFEFLVSPRFWWKPKKHDSSLHRHLGNLPWTEAPIPSFDADENR